MEVNYQQISYMTLIGMHETMHLVRPNSWVCASVCVCACMCVYMYVCVGVGGGVHVYEQFGSVVRVLGSQS